MPSDQPPPPRGGPPFFGESGLAWRHRRTTTSVDGVLGPAGGGELTPGLALVYARGHAQLPPALAFSGSVVTLGRERDNLIAVPEAAVSRYHARFERRPAGVWVVDAGSRNGTFVNGQRVIEQRLLDHDLLRVGDALFRFVADGAAPYAGYRIDGTRIDPSRPFTHPVQSPLLVGGYQIDALLDHIWKVARSSISVVVTGESGTGKELVAREIHRLSERKGPFQALNCAALPASLLESELFGYRRGAFSGAVSDKLGLVRAAHGGTLFLDEIGDMPVEAQTKLLRVLQEREVVPVGATVGERVDIRVVCATHRDLESRVAAGSFRGDLLARLRELSLELPALRRRREDLYSLVLHFAQKHGGSAESATFPFMLAVALYDWPYNVRELESAVRVAITMSGGAPLDVQHLPETVRRSLSAKAEVTSAPASSEAGPAAPTLRQVASRSAEAPSEQELRNLLVHHRGNIAAVGRELGKERMQIHRWLQRYGLNIDEFRS